MGRLLFWVPALAWLTTAVAYVQIPIQRSVVATHPRIVEGSAFEYHTVEVQIGTPLKKFNLTLDFGQNYAIVFDSSLQWGACTPHLQRQFFDASSSSTYQTKMSYIAFLLGGDQYFRYCAAGGGFAWGPIGQDVFVVPGVTTLANFGVVSQFNLTALQSFWPSDGILGLRHQWDGDWTTPTIKDLAYAVGYPMVTLYAGDDTQKKNGLLTLAGDDVANCDAKWTKLQQSGNLTFLWHLPLNGVKIGKSTYTAPSGQASLNDRTKTVVPKRFFLKILQSTGATYDYNINEYITSCDKANTLPDIVLKLKGAYVTDAGLEYRIPASAYVKNLVPRSDGKCTLLVEELPYLGEEWTLGWQAIKAYCWRFDYVLNEVAFAKVRQ